jgi:hypothetical protein
MNAPSRVVSATVAARNTRTTPTGRVDSAGTNTAITASAAPAARSIAAA